jgi:hypothetical protein
MTNKEIEKHKQDFAGIKNEFYKAIEILKSADRLKKLSKEIRNAQKLASDIGAFKGFYLTRSDTDIDKTAESGCMGGAFVIENIDACVKIFNELCGNIYYALQTEEMFNASVSAEQSCELAKQSSATAKQACFWAAFAAILSLITAIAAWGSIFVMLYF